MRRYTAAVLRNFLLSLLFALPLSAAETTVTLLHFSDYHSHAHPFVTDEGERGGIARAIGYLRAQKLEGALIFSGGDMMNQGSPAWSDKFQCDEWSWFNRIVDAMALGNHDVDYGWPMFERCRRRVRYPILSANTSGFPGTAVIESRGVRVGVFAVAGADFQKLVKVDNLTFSDPIAAAKDAVRSLRDDQDADVVVMIGHQDVDADYELARKVPGIDVIFGSHSHLKRELVQIPGTTTSYISPSQYLTYISRVELTVADGRVKTVRGTLVPVDDKLPIDARTSTQVRRMQRVLETDPEYRGLFMPIGKVAAQMPVDALAKRTVEAMRTAAKADIAIATKSDVRQPLPEGLLTMELLRASLPYDNEIIVCTMPGATLQRLLTTAGEKVWVSDVKVDPAREYRVATTDYIANVAYKDAFACERQPTSLRVRDQVLATFK